MEMLRRLVSLPFWSWTALILGPVVLSLGCNPITTMGFLLYPFAETKIQPECDLTAGGKETTVVILSSFAYSEVRPEFLTADRELNERLGQQLRKRFEENREKVTIIPYSRVRGYLAKHHDDRLLAKREVGKHFLADYVINIEVNGLGLYERGSSRKLLRGRAEIGVTAIDAKLPEGEGTIFERSLSIEYPENNPEDADNISPVVFRSKFYDHVAGKLCRFFAAYPVEERFGK
jgi:hypothetical protein